MKFIEYLKIKEDNFSTLKLTILILFAYTFSVVIRYILLFQISNNPNFFIDETIIPIWTPDAGLYGFYVKELLNGVNDPYTSEYIPAYLIYYIVKFSGFNIDTVMFYLPAYLSSLVVIPIILITKLYNFTILGFFSALLGSISLSYYSRTHLGYMDTDTLNVFFISMIVYFFMAFSIKRNFIHLILTSAFIFLFYNWYHSSLPIIAGLVSFFLLYILIFDNLNIKIKFTIISIMVIFGFYLSYKYDFNQFYQRGIDYLNKKELIETSNLKFKSTLSTVAEAQSSNIFQIAKIMFGSFFYFLASFIGLILIAIKYRAFVISYFLFILGIISVIAGFRFSMYGVGIASIGVIYTLFILKNVMIYFAEFSKKVSNITTKVLIIVILIVSILSILQYNKSIKPIFLNEDIKVLNNLKENNNKNDFILTWWDYGWPLWYFTSLNTLIDNGKHHEDNYIVSKILFSTNQIFVANASRYFLENYKKYKPKSIVSYEFTKNNPNELLNNLEKENFILPKKSMDIYILLDESMLFKLLPIFSFSNINFTNGQIKKEQLMITSPIQAINKTIIITQNFNVNLEDGVINIENRYIKIKNLYEVNENKNLITKEYHKNNSYNLINYNNRYLLLVDDKILNSFLIQTFIFENFDENYFKLITKTPRIKLLKLKI